MPIWPAGRRSARSCRRAATYADDGSSDTEETPSTRPLTSRGRQVWTEPDHHAQHVAFATKGHLRLSEGAWIIPPVVQLLMLARRRGIETDVDPKYHKLRMRAGKR